MVAFVRLCTQPPCECEAERFRADHPVLSLFGVDRVAPTLLTYRGYGVASAGWVGDELVTVGALGMVHVRRLDVERLGVEAGRQGKQGVREFLEGVREVVHREVGGQ